MLFVSREGVRMTILREKDEVGRLVNLSWVPVTVGSAFVAISLISKHSKSVLLYALATVLELASEPMYIFAQQQAHFGMRAGVEGAAVVAKTIASVLFIKRMDVVDAFALAQVVYSTVVFLGYTFAWKRRFLAPVEESIDSKDRRDSVQTHLQSQGLTGFLPSPSLGFSHVSTAKTYSLQSLLKLALNEGDRILLNMLASTRDQGIWAWVFNYGSLLVRMVLTPLEETSRVYFAKSGTAGRERLQTMVKLYTLVAFPFVFVAPFFTHIVVAILGGAKWMDAVSALSAYCVMLPFLAINGMVEGYVQSVASPKQLGEYSKWMILCWIVYGSMSLFLTQRFDAASSLIVASGVNSVLRSSWGIYNMMGQFPWPNWRIWSAWIVTAIAISTGRSDVLRLTIGIAGTLVSLGITYRVENSFIKRLVASKSE